jgi:Cys-tRNA(Pro)/Cys-tRNA(Cys) deacylase
MARATRATRLLEQAKVPFALYNYDYAPGAANIGLQAAAALGETPERVLKTLMALVDGKPTCAILASSREVSMKKLAAALGAKSAEMMKSEAAERQTGYKVGGISPFGQMKRVPTIMDQDAVSHDLVYLNGGQRGLQIRMHPHDAVRILGAIVTPIAA